MKIITSLIISALLCSAVATHAQTPVLDWAKAWGSINNDYSYSIALDASGNSYTTGYFQGTVDFDPGPGTYNLTTSSGSAFVSKLDASGNFVWARAFKGTIAGTDNAVGYGIAVDASGNVYTTGCYEGIIDFDPGPGIYNLTAPTGNGYYSLFVSKLDAAGNFVWAKSFGSSTTYQFYTNGIAVDASGNVYTTGYFQGTTDFDPGAGTYNLTFGGTFISKLNASGNFVFAKSLGVYPYNDSRSYGITLDASANIYITGLFGNTVDFDPGPGTVNLTPSGFYDIFVLKMTTAGIFLWAKSMGGVGSDFDCGLATAVDDSGNVYTAGFFEGTTDFDPGAGTYNLISAGGEDIFVSKLNSNGTFVWARNMGGTGDDRAYGVAIDGSHNVYTTGNFQLTADFDPDNSGIYNLTSAGFYDIFVSKLDANGSFTSAIHVGGTGWDEGYAIKVDAAENIYTTGIFSGSVDFDPGPDTDMINSLGNKDAFVLKLNKCASSSSSITVSVCDSYTAPDAQVYTTSGIKTAIIPNHVGCDSTITINLTIKHSTLSTISPVVCNSYTSPSGHHTWTVSNTYTDTIANHAGCDSIMTINLTVNHNTTATISPAVCNSYKSPSGLYTWTVSNTYMDTIANHAGCDSVLTINLTILTADVLVTNNSPTLVAHATGASYQWINCNTGFTPIAGQTGQSFTAVANGDYAVIVSQNGCIDTSACYNVYNVGILENNAGKDMKIYPNPANDKIIIENTDLSNDILISIYTVQGQLLYEQSLLNTKTEIDIRSFANGVYFVMFNSANGIIVKKFIKE